MPTEERSDDREHRGRQEDIFTEMKEKREEEKQRRFYVFKKTIFFKTARLSIHAGYSRFQYITGDIFYPDKFAEIYHWKNILLLRNSY